MAAPQRQPADAPVSGDEAVALRRRPLQRDVVVIGASAGGVEALETLVAAMPPELPAALFVVLHVLPSGTSVLPKILSRVGELPAVAPSDGESIERGHIYVAPPDHHLLLQEDVMRVTRGPRENGHRPAVDPLFRSAARAFGRQVIGVILSGSLDDGTAGLSMIRTRGGATIAQDPADAPYAGMPRSAIAHNAAEHVVPVAQMPELLLRLIDEPLGWEDIERAPLPPEEDEEEPILSLSLEQMDEADRRDAASGLTCPECGGALWERLESGVVRFACHVGHAYSPASLEVEQSRALEGALWTALRTLEERADLYRRLARRSGRAASPGLERRVAEMEHHADVLREAVLAYGREGRTDVEVN